MSAVEARTPTLPAELPPEGAATARGRPRLGRAVLQPALLAAMGVLALALAIGVLNARHETDDEVAGALATARLSRYLVNLPRMSDAQALTILGRNADLRHLRLRVTDGDGVVRIGAELPVSATEDSIAWTVARPEGPPWTVTLLAAPAGDWTAQALSALRTLAWLALALGVVLAATVWGLARSLTPAGALLDAMRSLLQGDASTLRLLPRMPVAEFEAFRGGLLQLSGTMQEKDRAHARATQQLLALQEADRSRLERSLFDNFGEPLGALRLDAVWLRRQLAANRQFEPVVTGMLTRLAQLSNGLRGVLAHLNPLAHSNGATGAAAAAVAAAAEHPERLRELLQALIDDGPAGAGGSPRRSLVFESDAAQLSRPLVLAVYRMSQEALLNAARHAAARETTLHVRIDGRSAELRWSVADDGRGLRAITSRGTGLDGMRALARAFGGELSAGPGPSGRGLVLRTTLKLGS